MSYLLDIVKRTELLHDFIVRNHGRVFRVFCYEDKEGDLKRPVRIRIVSESSLWVGADGTDDSIEVATKPSALTEADIVESISRGHWASFDGRTLVAAWLLTNQRGYTDGLQLGVLGPNEGLVIAQFFVIGSALSLKMSDAPVVCTGSLGRLESGSELRKRGEALARQLVILERSVEDCTVLSDVLCRRVGEIVVGVILVFGQRALSIQLTGADARADLLDQVPRDCESMVGDSPWSGLVGSGLMWLWCLTDIAGRIAGFQAEFWINGEAAGTRQALAVDEELKIFELN